MKKQVKEIEKTFLEKVASLPGDAARGTADRFTLVYRSVTDGPLTPYNGEGEWVYLVDVVPVADQVWLMLFGYHSGRHLYADYRSKGVIPPAERQEVDPPGFEWSEELGRYCQKVWRGALMPDRER